MEDKIKLVVVSLFDGLSGGRIALDRTPHVNVLRYYSSEIDKYAIQVADHNYPQDKPYRLGSVVDVDGYKLKEEVKRDFGDVDILLIGGSPCFVAGTKVITKDGYKNIEDVVVDDKVLTHTGAYKKVLKTGCKLAETLIVKAQGIKPTETTRNHPYYVREMKRKYYRENNKRYSKRVFGYPIWKEASELKKGDFIGININKKSENPLKLTKEECYILGRYIADGHTRKDYRTSESRENHRHWQLILSIGSNKVEDFCAKIHENHYSNYEHTKNVNRIVFSSKRLVEIAERYCGVSAISKRIPQILINLPKDMLEQVIDGYLAGDCSFRNGAYRATSISEELILSLSQAVAKVYRVNSSYGYTKRAPSTVIEGRIVNQSDTYEIEFRKEMKTQSKATVIDDIVWLPFKESINTGTIKQVFNLEVEEDNSYTANNAIVHNCQGFSMAGKLKGSSTACGIDVVTLEQYLDLKEQNFEFNGQSYLFWEYVRIMHELQPDYFMLENVRVTKKWLPMFNEAMGVEPLRIDSEEVCSGMRKRFYWTNIEEINPIKQKDVKLQDVLDNAYTDREKSFCIDANYGKGSNLRRYLYRGSRQIVFTDEEFMKSVIGKNKPNIDDCNAIGKENRDKWRFLTPEECEKIQTLPVGFTEGVPKFWRYHMIGNGWTIDVVAHIFSFIGKKID